MMAPDGSFVASFSSLSVESSEASDYTIRVIANGPSANVFWPSSSSTNDDGEEISTPTHLEGCCAEPSIFNAASSKFPLLDQSLTSLLTLTLSVGLYKKGVVEGDGGDNVEGEAGEAVLVGNASFPLSRMVSSEPDVVTADLVFLPVANNTEVDDNGDSGESGENGESPAVNEESTIARIGSCKLTVYLDDALSDAMLGGAKLTVYDVSVTSLPPAWKMLPPFDPSTSSAEEHHEMIEAEVEKKSQMYFGVLEGSEGALPSVEFGEGTWNYQRLEDGEAVEVQKSENDIEEEKQRLVAEHEEAKKINSEGDGEEKDGDEKKGEEGEGEFVPEVSTTKMVPTPNGQWSIQFQKPNLDGVFLSSHSISKLNSLVDSGGKISLTITRTGTTSKFGSGDAPAEEEVKKDDKKKKGKKDASAEADDDGEKPWVVTTELDLEALMPRGVRTARLTSSTDKGFTIKEENPALAEESEHLSQMAAVVKVAVTPSLRLLEETEITPSMGMGHVVGMRQWKPKKKPRDVAGELRNEIASIANSLSDDMRGNLSTKPFFERVQQSGDYHRFLECLRPAVQRAAHSRFREAPKDANLAAYRSELFTALCTQLNTVLVDKFTENEAVDNELFPEPAASFAVEFEKFAQKAKELVVEHKMEEAMTQHEGRVAVAKKAFATGENRGRDMLATAWNDMAKFCLTSKLDNSVDRALECIKQSAAVKQLSSDMQILNSLILLDKNVFDQCEESLMKALDNCNEDEKASVHASFCCLHDAINDLEKSTFDKDKESLRARGLPMATFAPRDLTRCKLAKKSLIAAAESVTTATPPRRRAVAALLEAVEVMILYNLPNAASRALNLAKKCEGTAIGKEKERNVEEVNVRVLSSKRLRLDSGLSQWKENVSEAIELAKKSCELDGDEPLNHIQLGRVLIMDNNLVEAAVSYENAVELTGDDTEVDVYLTLSRLHLQVGNYERGVEVAFKITRKFKSALAWRFAGECSFKMGEISAAENALQESLRIDSFSASAWANLALVAVAESEKDPMRKGEASDATEQAIKHDLNDSVLLRELGVAFNELGDFQAAEFMLRRSLVLVKSSHTKKVLAMVLNAREEFGLALAEYTELLEGNSFDSDERREIFTMCLKIFDQIGNVKRRERQQFVEKWGGEWM